MYTKPVCGWVFCLGCCLWLLSGSVQAAPRGQKDTGILTATRLADADADGVSDGSDLCPGTPVGMAVNAYGCPLSQSSCDYTTSTVTLLSAGGSAGSTVTTRYVLANNVGTILQISPTASFTGLTGTATYMAVAITYDGVVTNLSVGSTLSAVSASCLDLSDALVFKACIAPVPTCDYQVGATIVLTSAGGSTGAGVKTSYVLTDATGKLISVSATPSFSTMGLVAGAYSAYGLTYTDDASIVNLVANGTATLSQVTASCLIVSTGLSLTLCGGCKTSCVPILISRLR
ncbi:hypothetical protein [Spirosoma pollinicola]|uniref:Uncharacterized protein n=1 Tax=Spirosoma pollinicola TaxID=2057025 RepID=A0A2K8Z8P6_9BACT|nr:hypothetical protein [Spirosoma pollinicola]AUD06238.1 hypothetical protein CWM47_32980 [Spirosoma pollinicola]